VQPAPSAAPLCLAIDTATRTSVVAIGRADVLAASLREVRHRHGSFLLEQIDEVLDAAGASLDRVSSVAVGTGPGSFTGLRVGLATAKTIARARGLPIVGVRSSEALRVAAESAGAAPGAAVVLPAGAHDHYLVRAGAPAALVPPGSLASELGGGPAIAVDLGADELGADAARLGGVAVLGLAAALLALAWSRLEAGDVDDLATLVPTYVALPRGVRHGPEELAWSPDLR
jgi:tRNA threonylcarbamoyl adenosine modification protein YeaZ